MRVVYCMLLSIIIFLVAGNVKSQDLDFFESKTTVGGYGELHYNAETAANGSTRKTLDFHRFVLFFGYAWSEKWSFKSEVELEHNFVRGGQGELELEQAYVNYHHADYFGFQAGVILPSVGLTNEYHEPPLFLSVERPLYAANIIPTTWFGNGAAIYGNVKGFDYKIAAMEGLDADNFSASSGIRGGRIKGYLANAKNLLYNFGLEYLNIPGLRVGASYSFTNAISDTANTNGNNRVSLVEFHSQYSAHNIYAVVEYGNISFSRGNIENAVGYYADLGYNIGSFFNIQTRIIPFVRYSDINTAAETLSGGDSEKQNHFREFMLGISVMPLPEVVFKMDYSERERELGSIKIKFFNLGVGYMF